MTRSSIHYNTSKYLTEMDGDKGVIKANTEVIIIRTDGEDTCELQDKDGNRDTIDYAYLINF